VQAHINESYSENVESAKRDTSQAPWNFGSFPNSATVRGYVQYIISQNPTLASSVLVGKSGEGKNIDGVKIGTGPKIIVIHCTIHAREWITTTTCLYIIEQLVAPANSKLRSDFTWNIIPILNIDGYDYTHASPNNRLWRKNRIPSGNGCIGTDINRNFFLSVGRRWCKYRSMF